MVSNSIIPLAFEIDYAMKLFIETFPDNKNQQECEDFVVGCVMQKTKGHHNPDYVRWLVSIHREPMEEAGFILLC